MAARPPEDAPFVDSTAALASLYQAPLADFIPRRTALVAQLKRSGHKDVAASIAAAAKPSRAAYLVNQVFWRARATYDAVLEAGTAARAAQQARLLGDASTDLSDTLRRRDDAVRAAVSAALAVADDDGSPASDAIGAQVKASFEALAGHGLESRLSHGHLVAEVALPGMAAFAGLILPAPTAPAPARRFEVVARRPSGAAAEPIAAIPDPRLAEAERMVSQLEERRAAATERLEELQRSTVAALEVATLAEEAAAAAVAKAADARHAVERAEATRVAVEQDLARATEELGVAEAALRELIASSQGVPEPEPTGGSGARRPTRRSKR
jgi:hypothetical protein